MTVSIVKPLAKSTQAILCTKHHTFKIQTAARQKISFVFDEDAVGKIFIEEQIIQQLNVDDRLVTPNI